MEAKGEPLKRFICSFPACSAAYNKQWKLDSHLCKHTGVKPFSCHRGGCGKSFCSSYHLTRHELSHTGLKPFQCTVDSCEEAFTTNSNRTRHVSRVHKQEPEQKKYVCMFDGCGLDFRKNKQLRSHVCEQHSQLPPYQCTNEGCSMRFTFPSRLKRHLKVHRGYPCKEEGCCFTGKTWTEYLKHRKEQHVLTFRCDQCSKIFRDSWSLQQHLQVHAETRVVLRCPMDDCDRSFTKLFNLEIHIASFHSELRPFTCTHTGCGKTFTLKQSLQRHTTIHEPGRKKLKRSRPKRSMASRLSGYREPKKEGLRGSAEADPPGPVELVSLLQDTSLLCSSTQDTHGLTDVLTAPLTV